uniref:Ig-like domain-containing protein n=1 Tax=Leptobrachium leishanense TaxID=445787 RepID=A0A8C5P6H9_9ANUR
MSCSINRAQSVRISHHWFKKNTEIQDNSRVSITSSSRVSITSSSNLQSSSLLISSLTPGDTGLYVCQIQLMNGSFYTGEGTYLLVTGAAAVSVLQLPPSLILQEGQTANMSCSIEETQGVRILHYYWFMNGIQVISADQDRSRASITSGLQSSSLLISSLTLGDTGLYVCQIQAINKSIPRTYTGNGTRLLVTVSPGIILRMEEEENLLLCEAQRFHPQELKISWRFPLMEAETQDTLTENEDGTYTQRSTMNITEEMRGLRVTCVLEHISLTAPLHETITVTGSSSFDYRYLCFLLLLLLPLLCVAFIVRKHQRRRGVDRPETPETSVITKGRGNQSSQDQDGDSALHYATIFPSVSGAGRKAQKPWVSEEECTEYAAVKVVTRPLPHTSTGTQRDMEESYVCYAALRMSPPP